MGRKPLATATKEARGSFKKNPQRKNHNEPKPIEGRPEAPEIVKGCPVRMAKFNHLCEVLGELGLLSQSDVDLMAIYSVTWARWVRLDAEVKVEGDMIQGEKSLYPNQKVYMADKAMDRLYKLGGEFGLNPSSRSRLSAAPKENADPFLDFLEMSSKN